MTTDRRGSYMGDADSPLPHLAAAKLHHHVHVVCKESVEGHDVTVSQAAVQGDLALHLRAGPQVQPLQSSCRQHTSSPCGEPGHPWVSRGGCQQGRTFLRGRRGAAPFSPRGTTFRANRAGGLLVSL